MQQPSDYSRDQIIGLLQDCPSLVLAAGLEIVDINLDMLEDISGDLAGGRIERHSYADLHATAQLRISRQLDWGGDLVRPYLTISGGGISARWNLGVYHLASPVKPRDIYDVAGYDMLLRLAQRVGDAYSIAAGESYLARVEQILAARGYTRYVIDQTAAGKVAPAARVWAMDTNTTWLNIVNDLLGSIGYAGIWSDWDGRLRCEPYRLPIEQAPEWVYTDDPESTMLGADRVIERDLFAAPNRWVIYRSNLIDGDTPIEGDGIVTYVNEAVGDTSVQARRGLVITKVEGVDVADQGALVDRAQQIIDADMTISETYKVSTSPNPMHWHFDRIQLQDSATFPIADALCTQWSLPLPPDTGDMTQQWRILVR